MADYPSSLPVRSEADGTDERVHVKIVDYTDPDSVGKQADVSDGNVHVYTHGSNPSGNEERLRLSELGSTSVDGVYSGSNNTDPSQVGLVGMVRNDTPADSHQTLRLTGIQSSDGNKRSLDVAINDSSGEAITTLNPLPVNVVNNVAGDQKIHFGELEDLTKGVPQNTSYTITLGKTFVLQKVYISASSKVKAEVQLGPIASPSTVAVLFNSTAFPNAEYTFHNPQEMADTQTVKVVAYALDVQPFNAYVTIEGYEV